MKGLIRLVNEWVDSLIGRNASPQEIANEIIRRVAPLGGSQDEAACQESMAQAIEDLLTNNPGVDLLHLGDDNIWTLIESFLSYEAYHRLYLDIGQVFEDSALSPRDSVTRMNEMQNYLKAEIQAQIEEVRMGTRMWIRINFSLSCKVHYRIHLLCMKDRYEKSDMLPRGAFTRLS